MAAQHCPSRLADSGVLWTRCLVIAKRWSVSFTCLHIARPADSGPGMQTTNHTAQSDARWTGIHRANPHRPPLRAQSTQPRPEPSHRSRAVGCVNRSRQCVRCCESPLNPGIRTSSTEGDESGRCRPTEGVPILREENQAAARFHVEHRYRLRRQGSDTGFRLITTSTAAFHVKQDDESHRQLTGHNRTVIPSHRSPRWRFQSRRAVVH